MKLIFRVLVLICLYCKMVNGVRPTKLSKPKEIISLEVEPVKYAPDQHFLEDGAHKKISCKGSQRFQKLLLGYPLSEAVVKFISAKPSSLESLDGYLNNPIEWYDPSGNLVKREPTSRVFVQETFAPSLKTRAQALVLVFTHTQVDDSGIWECRSGDLKQEVPLCILDPTEFVETKEEVTIDEGRSITLTCQTKGEPEPKITWYKDGDLIEDDGEKMYTSMKYNHHGFESLLTVRSTTAEDSGTFVCEALQEIPGVENCMHTVVINITLNVNHRPNFDIYGGKEIPIFAKYNESVDLVCEPSAYPEPKFRWFRETGGMLTEYSEKQFKVFDDETRSVLTIVANSSTFGQKFQCLAENEFGEDHAAYQLYKLLKPSRVEISVSNATDTVIMFNVTDNDDSTLYDVDGFDIQYFEKRTSGSPREDHWKKSKSATSSILQGVLMGLDDGIVPLHHLRPEREYWVRIRAFNELGHGDWSIPILASTVEEPDSYESEDDEYAEPQIVEPDYGIFYGLLMTGIIIVAGAICIFIVKRV